MKTDLLDRLIQQRRDRNENARLLVLQKVQQWLNEKGVDYGIIHAWIFGSLTRPGHFHERSDVDIAINSIKPEHYFVAISVLSTWLERDVDLIELAKCPFQQRIHETGIAWTATPG
ncbi:MAG: nucleotidyltransferase domain-containing protein [Cyanobacteria bacterium P01_A01_bin.123]